MTSVFIFNASSWEEADAHFDTFMAIVPEHRRDLAARVAATGGPALDLPVNSVGPITQWFITTALEAPQPPDVDYWPAWLDAPSPDFVPGPDTSNGTPGWLALLWEQVGVYVGDVMMAQVPGSRWVCWRATSPRNIQNGLPVVDIGVRTRGFDAMGCANAGVIRTYAGRGTSRGGGWPDVNQPLDYLRDALARREEYVAENPPRWQMAPTGPKAKRSQAAPAV